MFPIFSLGTDFFLHEPQLSESSCLMKDLNMQEKAKLRHHNDSDDDFNWESLIEEVNKYKKACTETLRKSNLLLPHSSWHCYFFFFEQCILLECLKNSVARTFGCVSQLCPLLGDTRELPFISSALSQVLDFMGGGPQGLWRQPTLNLARDFFLSSSTVAPPLTVTRKWGGRACVRVLAQALPMYINNTWSVRSIQYGTLRFSLFARGQFQYYRVAHRGVSDTYVALSCVV